MLPGLFRTLVGLVIAWFVFRFLDRMFGGARKSGPKKSGPSSRPSSGRRSPSQPAKDDHLGEYVDYEEVDGED